jgi:diaminopimelate epimerase
VKGKSAATDQGLPFWKVEGAGNDFVLLDGRTQAVPKFSVTAAKYLLDRHRGVGGDGLLILRDGPAGVQVEFRNPDGNPADFCGNGARCAAAYLLGGHPGPVYFHLMKVMVEARRTETGFAVRVGPAERKPMPDLSRLRPRPADLVNVGVDHWIVPVGDVNSLDVSGLGQGLRHHPWPGPKGANVTFVERRRLEIRIRTYERGVEGETLSCGSGAVAAAHWALGGEAGPISIYTHGGDTLRVWRDMEQQYWLEGPARSVYSGIWPMAAAAAATPVAAVRSTRKG